MAKAQTKKAKEKAPAKGAKLTKAGLLQAILDAIGEEWSHKDVKNVLEKLTEIGHSELKNKGEFVVPVKDTIA